MKQYLSILKRTQLFSGVSEGEIEAMLSCLDAHLVEYKKGEYVFRQGARLSAITILVKGSLHIQNDDYWGNRTIVNHVVEGEMFGESYIAPESGPLLNDVVAVEDSAVIFFDAARVMTVCSAGCPFHSMVVQNLFFSISEQNRRLLQKISYISKRTTKDKLISYLSEEAKRQNSASFTIPFNRQQLADFLSVDRSAMSNELCKMRDQGLLRFERNRFELLQDQQKA